MGCGGINFSDEAKQAIISWDMLHPDFHGQKLGSHLLQYRLQVISTLPSVEKIIVRTSQHVYPFYEKNGFELLEIQKDYWAQGFDLYAMEYNAKSGKK